jgi:hypothetical protein
MRSSAAFGFEPWTSGSECACPETPAAVRMAPLDDAVPHDGLYGAEGLPDSASMCQPELADAVDSWRLYASRLAMRPPDPLHMQSTELTSTDGAM